MESKLIRIDQFEGPIELLVVLAERSEVELFEICLKAIIEQYRDMTLPLDDTSDFIACLSQLLYLKSARLLPKERPLDLLDLEISEEAPSMIERLIQYASFRDIAEDLSVKEEERKLVFPRGSIELPVVIDEDEQAIASINELADLFIKLYQEALIHASRAPSDVVPDAWTISDKITYLRQHLKERTPFIDLFTKSMMPQEMIVTFLAILELIKGQELELERHHFDDRVELYIKPSSTIGCMNSIQDQP